MTRSIAAGTIALALCLLAQPFNQSSFAASLGDPMAGKAYAQVHCASCHSIVQGGNTSPNDSAPPFQDVANAPGMQRTALIVFLRTPHETMPNLIVQGDDADNLIAYILSLKGK